MLLIGVQDRLSRFYGSSESREWAEASAIARAHANDQHVADTVGSIVEVSSKNGGDFFEMVNAVCGTGPKRSRGVYDMSVSVAIPSHASRVRHVVASSGDLVMQNETTVFHGSS